MTRRVLAAHLEGLSLPRLSAKLDKGFFGLMANSGTDPAVPSCLVGDVGMRRFAVCSGP